MKNLESINLYNIIKNLNKKQFNCWDALASEKFNLEMKTIWRPIHISITPIKNNSINYFFTG
jgi:hypothetical protein